ncbi:hypothetical protein G195_002140 [Phytophthora kernoviae 00238/432]|uniref:Uncharacterized protein n=1 Tax=Phytophthora kernoviae 00238/432 TaxID=1284355 RepID=A0A8J4SHP0_9STRA|nr:hypothetical protein G195_002140 [Phytophthora kernoviae 00238/432]
MMRLAQSVGALRSRRYALTRLAIAVTNGDSAVSKFHVARLSTKSTDKTGVLELLERVAAGKVSPIEAAEIYSSKFEYEAVGDYAKIDTKRGVRTGFPEVVYAESKTSEQVATIMKVMIDGGEDNVMASRVTKEAADEIRTLMPGQQLTYYEVPRILASKALGDAAASKTNEFKTEKVMR